MAFKLEQDAGPDVFTVKEGPMRSAEDNTIGVDFSLTRDGILSGKININAVKCDLKSKQDLISAIESAINDSFKVKA